MWYPYHTVLNAVKFDIILMDSFDFGVAYAMHTDFQIIKFFAPRLEIRTISLRFSI